LQIPRRLVDRRRIHREYAPATRLARQDGIIDRVRRMLGRAIASTVIIASSVANG
jgi:hypothetical protein